MARSHLWEIKRGYWSHLRHAFMLSWLMLRAGMAGVIHAVFPQFYVRSMSKTVAKLHHEIQKDKTRVRITKRKD